MTYQERDLEWKYKYKYFVTCLHDEEHVFLPSPTPVSRHKNFSLIELDTTVHTQLSDKLTGWKTFRDASCVGISITAVIACLACVYAILVWQIEAKQGE